ncbi:MAG TPA: metallophosphoesterase [Gaiellaceae bacterium]|nr:metallophosphoesterase [Gaiellaceae bacterium]
MFGRRAGAFLGAALGWGLIEAGWPRLSELELPVPGLPPELDGLRVMHLSDFHLGVPSPGTAAVEKAVEWTVERPPDLVVVTGDLLTHPRGESALRDLVGRLPQPTVAILGNHDVAISRDPQAVRSDLTDLAPATLLRDEGMMLELRGRQVWIAGVHPRLIVRRRSKLDPNTLSREADLRILLSHYPRVFDALEPGRFELVLAGHMHDGQIALPYPGGKIRFAHLSARYPRGVFSGPAGVMHVSPGLGTTFVPFRFAARPEATELTLRPADADTVSGGVSHSARSQEP